VRVEGHDDLLRRRTVEKSGDGAENGVLANLKLEYCCANRIANDTHCEGLGVGDNLGALEGRQGLWTRGAAAKTRDHQEQ
jgi:hypothetical protein